VGGGAATASEHLAPFPQVHCGHKALFFDRLDVGVGRGGGASDGPPRLIPYAHLMVHMRNRAYSPQMGRFMQPDPNATAMMLIEAASYHGRGLDAMVAAFDVQGMYGDGMSLYAYLGSNPWMRSDPLGLSWDPFSMVDDFQAEMAGSTAAFLSALGQSARATAVVAAQIASYLPFPFVGNLGEVALYALGESSGDDLAMAMALGMIPGGKLAAKFGGAMDGLKSLLNGIGGAAWSAAKEYAGKVSAKFSRGDGLAARARMALRACPTHCFEAGTEVWTVRGLVPIAEIVEGDLVVATDEHSGQLTVRPVVRTFVRPGAPLIELTLKFCDGNIETLGTTEHHSFYVPTVGWRAVGSLNAGQVVQAIGVGSGASLSCAIAEIEGVIFTSRLETVYNFEVEGIHNYRVGNRGILVHNGSPCKLVVLSSVPTHRLKYAPKRRGEAPIDFESNPIELHHPNSSDPLTVREWTYSEHRGTGAKRPNHPSPWTGMSEADRATYKQEKWLYWAEQWDSGRFTGLPSKP